MSLSRPVLLLLSMLSLVPAGVAARFEVEMIPTPAGYRLDVRSFPALGPGVVYEYPVDPFSDLPIEQVLLEGGTLVPSPPPPPGYSEVYYVSSNDLGELTAYALKAGTGNQYDGVTYKDGTWTVLGDGVLPVAVNDRGDVTGESGAGGFVLEGGKFLALGTAPGQPAGSGVSPVGINLARQVAGNVTYSAESNEGDHTAPVLYRQGRWTPLPAIPGALNTRAIALNQLGAVLVNWTDDPADVGVVEGHAALLRRGNVRDLGDLPGGTQLEAFALDDFRDVVGSAYVSGGQPHAWLYSGGRIEDLNDLVEHPGYFLSGAAQINDLGQIVVNVASESPEFVGTQAILRPICPGSAAAGRATAEELKANALWCSVSALAGAK